MSDVAVPIETAAGGTGTAATAPTGGSAGSMSSAAWASAADLDPELWAAVEAERDRQSDNIELIASENYVWQAVLDAQGTWLTNKYAEGLPGKRYYGGCEHVDVAENLARNGHCACSRAPITSTSNRMPAPRPTWRPTSRCSGPATGSWA